MSPCKLIELGVVRGAYGLNGWVRIAPFAAEGVVLESVRRWWLMQGAVANELAVEQVRRHGESIVAKWQGCENKEAADALKSATIAVARQDFPAPAADEYYLDELIGYQVVNRQGIELGTVSGLRVGNDRSSSGAGTQWLEVTRNASESLLIPLVDQYVEAIEPDARQIKVDWQSDW